MPRSTDPGDGTDHFTRIQLYLSPEMIAFLDERALFAGISRQEYLRHLVTGAMEAHARHRSVAAVLAALIGDAPADPP